MILGLVLGLVFSAGLASTAAASPTDINRMVAVQTDPAATRPAAVGKDKGGTGTALAVAPVNMSPGASCPEYWLCLYEHAFHHGKGYGIRFYDCGQVGLHHFSYPGPGGGSWIDRVSSVENHQSSGTISHFYDVGSNGQLLWVDQLQAWNSFADLNTRGWNDRLNFVTVC